MMPQEHLSEILEKRYQGFTGYCGILFDEILDGGCKVSCAIRPELLNPSGIVHGGMIATLADVAAGLMALQADGWVRNIVTQNCNLHYLRPGTGDRLWAESHVVRKGRRMCVVRVDCYSDADSLCTTAIYEIAYLDER